MKHLFFLSSIITTSVFATDTQDNSFIYKGLKNVNAEIGIAKNSNIKPSSCNNILKLDPSSSSGYYDITINDETYNLYCDMDSYGGGWTLFAVGIGGSDQSGWSTTNEGNSSERGQITPSNSWKLSDSLINNFDSSVFRFEYSGYSRFFKSHNYIHNRAGATLLEANTSYGNPELTINITTRSNSYASHRGGLSDDIFNSYDGRSGIYWQIWSDGSSMNNSFFNGYDYTSEINFCDSRHSGCNIYLYLK